MVIPVSFHYYNVLCIVRLETGTYIGGRRLVESEPVAGGATVMIADLAGKMGLSKFGAAVAAPPVFGGTVVDDVDDQFAEGNEVGERRHGHFCS